MCECESANYPSYNKLPHQQFLKFLHQEQVQHNTWLV